MCSEEEIIEMLEKTKVFLDTMGSALHTAHEAVHEIAHELEHFIEKCQGHEHDPEDPEHPHDPEDPEEPEHPHDPEDPENPEEPTDPHDHDWQSIYVEGEGQKIVTHGGLMPDYSHNPTHTLTSGYWSSKDLPENARVVIPHGVTVTYDSASDTRIESIAILGTLRFSRNVNTRLRVGTIMVYPGGNFDQGTKTSPVLEESIIVYDGVIDNITDPEQIGLGLVAFGGNVNIWGSFDGQSTTTLSTPASVGSNTIEVDDCTGWKVGDEILLHDSNKIVDRAHYVFEAPTYIISAINGNQVQLSTALKYSHDGDVDHISRNILHISDISYGKHRAHSMYMGSATAIISGIRRENMGRTNTNLLDDTIRNEDYSVLHYGTNPRARYPEHSHHMGTEFLFDREVVIGSPKWGITHHASFGTVSNCNVINAVGAGISCENGYETGWHYNNSVCRYLHSSLNGREDYTRSHYVDVLNRPVDDRGFGGFGHWYRGPLVEVLDCKANGLFTEAFSWNVEPLGVNNRITIRPVEGMPEDLAGQTFQLEITPLRKVDGLKVNTISQQGIVLWGWRQDHFPDTIVDNVLKNVKVRSCGYFSTNCIGLAHYVGRLTVIDGDFKAAPELGLQGVISGTYSVPMLQLGNISKSGITNTIHPIDSFRFPLVVYLS